jgi:hypothetical protein
MISDPVMPDPTKEDLWIGSLMGPAHLFKAGQSTAVCGRPWISDGWDASRHTPPADDCCLKCHLISVGEPCE